MGGCPQDWRCEMSLSGTCSPRCVWVEGGVKWWEGVCGWSCSAGSLLTSECSTRAILTPPPVPSIPVPAEARRLQRAALQVARRAGLVQVRAQLASTKLRQGTRQQGTRQQGVVHQGTSRQQGIIRQLVTAADQAAAGKGPKAETLLMQPAA